MKKTMIFTLILMPLVILGILLLSGSIVNKTTHLYVEYIEFAEKDIVLSKDSDADVLASVSVNVYPKLAKNKEVEYWSGDENIVTISTDGIISGHDFGTTYIYAKSKENETKQASCKVTVTSDRVHRLWINNTISTMYVGENHLLDVKYAPSEALDTSLDYVSSDSSILSVAIDGEMVARSAGKAKVTVYLRNNHNISTSMEILVKEPVQGIWINNSSPEVSGKGEFIFPSINFVPEGAIEDIVYTSSDTGIATVDALGNITFVKSGSVDITASIVGGKSITKKYTSTLGYFSGITFDQSNIKNIRYEDYINTPIPFILNPTPSDGDISNIALTSSDDNVLRIFDGKGYVTGGGRVTIRATAKTSKDTSIYAEWTIDISRNVESIFFGVADFTYTSSREVNLSVNSLPLDGREEIKYILSNDGVASIIDGKLRFSSSVISSGYGKVKVTAKVDSGAQKSVTIVYIDSNTPLEDISNKDSISLNLPKTGERAYKFALIDTTSGIRDIELSILSGSDNVTISGDIITLVDKGSVTIGIKYSGESEPSRIVNLNIARLVEEIRDVKVTALWQDRDSVEFDADDNIYSSSNEFAITYTLYPYNTSTSSVKMETSSENCVIVNNVISFASAGTAIITLSVDGVARDISITSTYLYPDKDTVVANSVTLNAGDISSVWNYLNISPIGASHTHFSFEVTGNTITFDGENITAICGGNSTLRVTIDTIGGLVTKNISINVKEKATKINAVSREDIVTDKFYITLLDKFAITPASSNVDRDISYEIIDGTDISYINSKSELVFSSPGKAIVEGSLINGSKAQVVIEYTGSVINVINLDDSTTQIVIDKGNKYILKMEGNDESIKFTTDSPAISVDSLGIFEGLYGSSGKIAIDGEEEIDFIVTEDVEEIRLDSHTISDGYITALGSIADDRVLNLDTLYGAYIYPSTARNSEGVYKIEYILSSDIATISDNILGFNKMGSVTIEIKAGDKSITRSIESTLGYAKSITFKDNNKLVFDYDNYSQYLLDDIYTIYPSDAYKAGATFESTDSKVFVINDNAIALLGGGSAKLKLKCNSAENEVIEIGKDVYVISRVEDINTTYNGVKTNYIVTNLDKGNAFNIDYNLVSNIQVSDYRIEFISSNTDIATIDNRSRVTIQGDGDFAITIRVADIYNALDDWDKSIIIRVINSSGYDIVLVNNDTSDIVLDGDDIVNTILYPLYGSSAINYTYTLPLEQDILDIDEEGKITILKGGETTLNISSSDDGWTKSTKIYVHKLAGVAINEDNIVTALKEWNIDYTLSAEETLIRKDITFVSSNEDIATVSQGIVTFKKAGSIRVTISIVYLDSTESSKSMNIRSTFGNVESFDIDKGDTTICVNENAVFNISNIYPSDYIGTLAPVSTNNEAYSISVSGLSIIILGTKGGTSTLTIKFASTDSVYKQIAVEIVQISESIEIQYNNKAITSLKTFDNSVNLMAVILPYDTKNKGVSWDIENIDGKATIASGKVTFTSFGSVKVMVTADDGGASNSIIVEYVRDIEDFTLSYTANGESVGISDNDTIYVDWNVNSLIVTINIEPNTLTDFDNYSAFTGSGNIISAEDMVVSDRKITINLTDFKYSPVFDDTITINYRGKIDRNFRIYRDGIQRVDFVDHDNSQDTQYGLQQMRLFGNRSYYDGAIQTYYRMNVNVYNSNVISNSLNGNIVWKSSNNSVAISSKEGYADIYFNTITGSTVDEIYNDDFSKGEVTISACRESGEILATYTFHIVNAVNVFDEAGYLGSGSAIVLHSNLTPTTYSTSVTTIYGNGKLFNIAVKNNKEDSAYESNEYVRVTLTNLINATLNGANANTDNKYINLVITDVMVYSDVKYLYRCMPSNNTKMKRSVFTSFEYAGILSQVETGGFYLEDMIMFDVGPRGIEVQKAGNTYVKGFLDVYNYQNKSMAAGALGSVGNVVSSLGSLIMNLAGDYKVTKNNEDWVNIVGISTKSKDYKFYYYDEATGNYVFDGTDSGEHDSARGLCRISDTIGFWPVKYDVTAWVYKPDHEYLSWENEYNSDGSLNTEYLIKTSSKLLRLAQ